MRQFAENEANDTNQDALTSETVFERVICIDMPGLAHFEPIATVNSKFRRIILCCVLPTPKKSINRKVLLD